MHKHTMILGAVLFASLAQATTYTVTSTGDNGGANPAVGAGTGTLRQAIVDSNAAGGTNAIDFNIPGSGPFTIALAARLPFITSSVAIDGFSQSGSAANTNTPDQGPLNTQLMVALDGGNAVDYGFFINGNVAVTLSGLAINGFYSDAIDQEANGSLQVQGCFVGTQLDGTAFPSGYGNNGVAIRIGAGHANIGGTQAAQRNLISGSRSGGIFVAQGSAAVIEGNLIGSDATGTLAIPSGINSNWPGILLPGNFPNIRVGCTGSGCTAPGSPSRNVISGNHNVGIGIWGNGQDTGGLEIKGNYIGTDWSGTRPLPNGHLADSNAGCPTYCAGIQLVGSSTVATPASIIGGFNPGEANLIAFNNGAGIISSPQYAANGAIGASFDSQRNLIHHNNGVDNANIDIGAIGPTPNDPGDGDAGANNVQNWPEILSASQSGDQLTVTYLVDSTTANSTYPLRVDFYVDASGGSAVSGGSGLWLAQDIYPSSAAQMMHAVTLTIPAGVQAIPLVATATDTHHYTSEFSPAYVADRIFANGFE
jgi:hypothetical protein